MPQFDKEEYRTRRNRGWRGQVGDRLYPVVHFKVDWPSKPVSIKAARKHSKRWRKAQVSNAV